MFGLIGYAFEEDSPIDKQRALIDTAYSTFPKDTAYFDFMGMLAEQPKANPFVTPATLKQYHLANRSIYRAAMEERPVPLLVDDDFQFQQLLSKIFYFYLLDQASLHLLEYYRYKIHQNKFDQQ